MFNILISSCVTDDDCSAACDLLLQVAFRMAATTDAHSPTAQPLLASRPGEVIEDGSHIDNHLLADVCLKGLKLLNHAVTCLIALQCRESRTEDSLFDTCGNLQHVFSCPEFLRCITQILLTAPKSKEWIPARACAITLLEVSWAYVSDYNQ